MLDIPGYRVLGTIRASGSNALFQAVREADGLPVIIKTPMAPSPGPSESDRYRREFALLQRLRDVRGVVRPYACERLRERPVLLLERVQGETLSESTGQALEVPRFLHLAISLASTLAEVHCRNVIHKDIKPSNIILEPSGEARLIDFGVATLQKVEHLDAAPTHLIEGTLAYMSPEQTGRMNRAVDYRTDFYSLGVTFYELLTGRRPFHGRDALEWFHAHMAQKPAPPHELNSQVPPALSAIVLKLLAKVAEERYQSAEGLKADLEQCREALSQSAQEVFELGTRDAPNRFQLPQRLYGREAQVSALLEGFERVARTGRPELLLISGYSGIGKSSVVHELHKPVVQRRGFFLSGKFDQFQRDIPYATLAQAIRGLVQQLLAGSDEELAAWRERVNQAWEGQGQLLVNLVPQLELLVGPQPALQEMAPTEAKNRFRRVVGKFLSVFATQERPMVVFLDDLQWADMASLQLLEQLLSQQETPTVLWLGAYRDNEVSSAHPLVPMLEEVRKAGAKMTDLRLEPLCVEQVKQLVGDTLPGADEAVTAPLAALVHEKTGGNPFFLLQLLVTLHQDGLLVRMPEGGWRWDAEGVRARDYSENIVDFMVGKLRQFPPGTQNLLRLAACAGNAFSLQLLGTLAGMEALGQVEQGLESALQEGMLVHSGPGHYRFLHDRIQQAAHSLISEQERKAVHLRIGRLLLENLSQEDMHETLFDVVSQLNAGADLIDDPAERHHLARLNAEAGWKAKAAVALRPAITYLSTAFSLIPGDPWETDHELAFKVRLAQGRCELMSGNISEALRQAEMILSRVRTRSEIATAYILKNDAHFARGELRQGAASMLECLNTLGMPLPHNPSWEEAVAAHEEAWAMLGDRPIESLLEQPLMTDPDMKVSAHALFKLFGVVSSSNPHLLVILLSRFVCLILRHGFVDIAALGYCWFGVMTSTRFKRYREGHAFGRLGLALLERHKMSAYWGDVLLGLQFSSYWTQPISRSLELALNSFHHASQAGDIAPAAFSSLYVATNRLAMGHNLDEVHQESLIRGEFLRQTGFVDCQDWLLAAQRYVQQMRGRSLSFGTLDGDGFEEQSFEARLTSTRMLGLQCFYWITKMQSRFMCGAYGEAREAGSRAASAMWGDSGTLNRREFTLFHALSLAASFDEATPEQQRQWLEDIQRHHRQLEEWAEHCPENFRALERLVSAELARLAGKPDEATRAYEEAICSARESGATQYVGLAGELAANFWRTRQAPIVAHAFAREARAAYLQWGALGKVQHLDTLWPNLAARAATQDALTTSSTNSTRIDALTVVKAQQAVSGEIVLDRLVTTLMQAAIENAGAQRGALLLPNGDTLSVAATFDTSSGGSSVPKGEEEVHELPWTILAFVRRTREHVLIGDASKPHRFPTDPYLSRSGARSVLCLPLLRQEQFSGALYLENNLATNAFSPGRLALLGHIASQAAISIENARLYADVQRAKVELRQANDELEQRVDERTRELKAAQARLVDTAREVGMAEVASNVLHNVGNVLTSAVINLEMMRQAVGASRVSRLKQASALLLENREKLADFLANDPKGRHLPDYLAALAEEMMREQTRLMEDMDAMGRHVEHIRAIVQVQQTYARTSLMTEECDLAQLIDDALRIQLAALQRHGVNVRREVSPVPKVKVDKHKVLQILINLISNAKNALDEVSEGRRNMWVKLMVHGQVARIQVVDDGVGIAPGMREKLFAHGFTTRKDGHGFGLHSSALAAQMLKGTLTLESEGPGKGAVATLELPLT
ncbi:trifunctional serine/threonine-protein kinase/ATP-binding protein/sensor histidine kinase [Vitiosangium sp. GDMCC 1.1324]|uniref:trifunctional serine/threonine-protein kinase/ATP-binding protein/sensor histidine kinase n=1 Tax=Vitiosangium sp. (strain GDMCC 1.1324) TaxID=2138576 RepID=UPI000D3C396A|nr:trifunctional serine/threonine-protein kinase/ATP-binding protein/sensor histidine kinase [Vitiosangium sp. GDMCC 1.1324]PTL84005.1 histidine kinase [Vitiosangium sp. GDMCC 1.1324]